MKEEFCVQLEIELIYHSCPELKLWSAVLLLAILDAEPWIKGFRTMTQEQFYHGKKALNWLLSESNHHGSFSWVCHLLELDKHKIRDLIGCAGKPNIW